MDKIKRTQPNGLHMLILGNVEGGMNLHGPRKPEQHSKGVNDLRYQEWTLKPGSQLMTISPPWQISFGDSDF